MSDHLCWGSLGRRYAHDLLPLPYTEEALDHVVGRVRAGAGSARAAHPAGERLELRRLPRTRRCRSGSSLGRSPSSADCGILLDVNNVFVSAVNHGFRAADYLAGLPADRVGQIHLAGHSDHGTHLLDTHDDPVRGEVWDLYRDAVRRFGALPTLVEWDDHVPPIEDVLAEAERARAAEAQVLGTSSDGRTATA